MVTLKLASFEDVRQARARVGELARAAGLQDAEAAILTTGELGNNCVEHGGQSSGLLRVGSGPGWLSLQFENRCARRPNWLTRKPEAVEGFRTRGYGLPLARALARCVDCRWTRGRVIISAEFSSSDQ
jgi:anti-sigma regulatory factor (Ser/Thr protein kinase)